MADPAPDLDRVPVHDNLERIPRFLPLAGNCDTLHQFVASIRRYWCCTSLVLRNSLSRRGRFRHACRKDRVRGKAQRSPSRRRTPMNAWTVAGILAGAFVTLVLTSTAFARRLPRGTLIAWSLRLGRRSGLRGRIERR